MRRFFLLVVWPLLAWAAAPLNAQQTPAAPAQPAPIDSFEVVGASRVPAPFIISATGLVIGQRPSPRDIQRAIAAVYRSGGFDDVKIDARLENGKNILIITVVERPLLASWTVVGAEKIPVGLVRDQVKLLVNRPVDRVAIAHGQFAIDSLYRNRGYYSATVTVAAVTAFDGRVDVTYTIVEGERVAISMVEIEGEKGKYSDGDIVKHMASQPEGFWWWQKGAYDEDVLEGDIRERLPAWYASRGYIDFQVVDDSLIPDVKRAKATLRLTVDEGPLYTVGTFDMIGNRQYSTEELMQFYPFGPVAPGGAPKFKMPFNRSAWEKATESVQNLYANTGYIYAQVVPEEIRKTGADGQPVVELRWNIREGNVVTVNKINIIGNEVTHERVIREAIVLYPGQVFSREALIRSWQNIANLGFFQQPMPTPDVVPSETRTEVDITFRVEEKHTGNINFGASLGQGTGIGGFIGLEEPNLFGQGKRGKLQWQFGRNIQDLNLSYTDPNIRETRISGTLSIFDSRARYVVGDLGRRRQAGGLIQFGFPLLGARYTRLFLNYGLQKISYSGGSVDLRLRYSCVSCTRSTLGASIVKDTRVGLPFATGGSYLTFSGELNGGILGGTGNFQKFDVEARFYAPLGVLGGNPAQLGSGVQLVLAFAARSGFIFGDAGPFFTELYSMGGVQFGIPLRGYPEFSITPNGYDPLAATNRASPNAFGKSAAAFNVSFGARVSQFLYVSIFADAGNNYRSVAQWDPTRLMRGAGFGVAVVSPLGPIGIDLGYGFDRTNLALQPDPGWQLHFRLGNFF
jgi:outer membrane protein insertion porin family